MRTRTRRSVAVLSGLTLLLAACGDDPADPTVDEGADAPAEETDTGQDEGDGEYTVEDQPEDAAATFASPSDGDTISGPVTVQLEAEGVDVVEAGAPVVGEGHLHVIVDQGCVGAGEVVPGPSDEATADGYNHYGDGSEGSEIELEPGEYELCAELADGAHTAFGQTETISITVE